MLSLEHQGDVVPLLDLAPNADSVEQVTVTFDGTAGPGGLEGEHGYEHYVAGAALADASTDPGHPRAARRACTPPGSSGPGEPATSQVFQITREP